MLSIHNLIILDHTRARVIENIAMNGQLNEKVRRGRMRWVTIDSFAKVIFVLAICGHSLQTAPAWGQIDTARNKGMAWLMTHQLSDGSWRNTPGSEIVATAAAVEAFANAGLKNFSYSLGISWLANAPALSVDTLSRQMIALGQSKLNVAFLFKKLIQWRNGQAGWGAYEGFETSFPDTSLALRAIRAR